MQLKALLTLALISSAIATPAVKRDLQTVQTALSNVQKAVVQLDTSIKAITGQPTDAAQLLTDSQNVQMTLQASTQMVQGTAALSLNDAVGLQDTANGLTAQ